MLHSKYGGIMKKVLFSIVVASLLSACGTTNDGQLTGVQDRVIWFQQDPVGMLYIPPGSYNMGPSDQDAPYSLYLSFEDGFCISLLHG